MDICALNLLYKCLDKKAYEITEALNRNPELKSVYGYYNGHYYMDNGKYEKSFYPIPVKRKFVFIINYEREKQCLKITNQIACLF